MKFGFKKILSGVLAGALALSLCGCSDNGYIMKVDGMDIRNGVYLYYQQDAYATACDKLNEIYAGSSSQSGSSSSSSSESSTESSSSSSSSSSMDFFTQSIENESSSDWVKEETLRLVRQFVAVQRLAEQKNITLSDEDKEDIDNVMKEMYDTENFYYQLYGFKNLGEYYEKQGISRETMQMLYEVNSLKSKLFMQKYDEGGENAVPEADITAYLKEHYAGAQLLSIPYNDKYGKSTTDAQRINELQARAQSYVDMLREGKSFADVKYECELATEREIAEAEATDEYNKSPVEGKTLEEYVKEKLDEVKVDKTEEKDTYSVLNKDDNDTGLDDNLIEYIKNADTFDFAVIFPSETDKCVYVVVVNDVTKNADWLKDNRETVLSEIKGDEFEGYLDIYSQNYSVEKNAYLVDTKYSPEKLFK